MKDPYLAVVSFLEWTGPLKFFTLPVNNDYWTLDVMDELIICNVYAMMFKILLPLINID